MDPGFQTDVPRVGGGVEGGQMPLDQALVNHRLPLPPLALALTTPSP